MNVTQIKYLSFITLNYGCTLFHLFCSLVASEKHSLEIFETLHVRLIFGAFRSNKFYFEFPVQDGRAFSRKEDNFARYNQIFGKFISRISASFLIFSVEWVTSRKFSNFQTYCKFSQGIFVPFVPVSQLSVISFS